MEVPISAGEIMQSGGLGATDDIGTILPSAIDSTDFEDHLRDVQSYEDITSEGESDFPTIEFEGGKANNEVYEAAVNMEAYVTSEEVIRAGGFGATDNIGSFLPSAVDFTDFEESLRDARDYEESQEKSSRPGLGWKTE